MCLHSAGFLVLATLQEDLAGQCQYPQQNYIANVTKYVGLRPPWLGRSSMIGIANAETVMQDVNVTWMSAIVARRSCATKEITG